MAKEKTGFLKGAYDLHGPDDNSRHYDNWANSYDEMMTEYHYVAPARGATLLARYASSTGKVLGCGCGTGLAGEQLKSLGFTDMDGIDISANMLRQARAKGVYGDLSQVDLTAGLNIADNVYDAVISVGTFTIGHVGPDSLPELARITRANGVVIFTVNEMVYEKEKYPEKLRDWAAKFRIEECVKDAYILETDNEGYYIVLRVL